jgi:hypothetical protein
MVVSLSALNTGRLYPPGDILSTHLCWRLSRPQGHSLAGRNQTQGLPASNAVRQPNAARRTSLLRQQARINKTFPLVAHYFVHPAAVDKVQLLTTVLSVQNLLKRRSRSVSMLYTKYINIIICTNNLSETHCGHP